MDGGFFFGSKKRGRRDIAEREKEEEEILQRERKKKICCREKERKRGRKRREGFLEESNVKVREDGWKGGKASYGGLLVQLYILNDSLAHFEPLGLISRFSVSFAPF